MTKSSKFSAAIMKCALAGLFLFGLLDSTSSEDYRVHNYVSTPMIWNDARSYCKSYFSDLSTITTEMEFQRLVNAGGNFSEAWIGLSRVNSFNWIWADGHSSFLLKAILNNKNSCGYTTQLEWFGDSCNVKRPFFCYNYFKPNHVTPNMAWEDALSFCRSRYIDLACATDESELQLLKNSLTYSKTDSVWMGLRFLAGKWYWVSRGFSNTPYKGSLPSCPLEPYRCGAFNTITSQIENRNCDETLNFICF